ncbi:hypothetical protein LIER_42167 [Lithospermum erythrorhizon]|uniref:Uncharacterized protein n=1 Tax=Lithospermum erythrorhizon TaxID=34254 RepID=A0AAV3RM96_LITER
MKTGRFVKIWNSRGEAALTSALAIAQVSSDVSDTSLDTWCHVILTRTATCTPRQHELTRGLTRVDLTQPVLTRPDPLASIQPDPFMLCAGLLWYWVELILGPLLVCLPLGTCALGQSCHDSIHGY